MTQTLEKSQDQRLLHSGINWQQFKLIQKGFAASPGIRLFYDKGEVEILAVSQDHETISRLIGILLAFYLVRKKIEFKPTGSFTQEKEGVASAQAGESYFIGKTSGKIPDLSIEVVFTSGNERKLNRYRALEVPEVWFWEDGVFALYHLQGSGYERIKKSEVLPDLDLGVLGKCLLSASSTEAILEWETAIA
ncbi:MAG: Uma2 family endonuclease [Cyanobacteriota bacterium]|nr:Uma2 family endonuclease [Cyanobacteriota bacterium]